MARALILSPLVPLIGVGLLGMGMKYRSVSGLAQFVAMWALVLYPLVVGIALGGYLAGRRLGCTASWHFGSGGLLAGLLLGVAWFGPLHPEQGSPVLPTIALCATAGVVGAATAVTFWYLGVRKRAV